MIIQEDIFGLNVSDFTLKDVDQLFAEGIANKCNVVVFGHSLGYITMFKKYPELYQIVNNFDLMVCDGTQFNWYCKILGFKLSTVMSIPDITNYAMTYANTHRLKVLLLGARPEVNALANDRLKAKYPDAVFLPGIDGYFKQEDEVAIVNKINMLGVDILLIGISTPKKEVFTFEHKQALKVGVIIPCGGMIDVYAGITKQTPALIKKIGLATPYRVLQEPGRLLILNVWMIWEIFLKILPITLYNRFILKKTKYNMVLKYIGK